MSDASSQPFVVVHEAVLEAIASAGPAPADRTGVLVGGPSDGREAGIDVLDAAPLSEIAAGDTWTSEAVEQAHAFVSKWHPGKRVVGWYRAADRGTVWHGVLGRTAQLLGPAAPLAVLVDPRSRQYLVYAPGLLGRKRDPDPVTHTLVSGNGDRREVKPSKAASQGQRRPRRARSPEEVELARSRREMELAVQELSSEVGWRPKARRAPLWQIVLLVVGIAVCAAVHLWFEAHSRSTAISPMPVAPAAPQVRPGASIPRQSVAPAAPQLRESTPSAPGPSPGAATAAPSSPQPRAGRVAPGASPQTQAPGQQPPVAAAPAVDSSASGPTTVTVEVDPAVVKQLTDMLNDQ